MCAQKAHIGIWYSVPESVPKRGPTTIIRQPTPTKFLIKNGPEIDDFRPVLRFLAALANRRLQPLGHLTDPVSIRPATCCAKVIVPATVPENDSVSPCHAKPTRLPRGSRVGRAMQWLRSARKTRPRHHED
jgi:hypothetical protein